MKRIFFALAWIFIFLAAAYDCGFAWDYRHDFDLWEINPVARWIVRNSSIQVLLGSKVLVLLLTAALAVYCHRKRNRLAVPMTLIIGCSYLLLSVHYLLGTLDIRSALAGTQQAMARP